MGYDSGWMKNFFILLAAGLLLFVPQAAVWGGELQLQGLIDEALKASPAIQTARAKALASTFRVPQTMSLPDPMVMAGYQNVGTNRLTFNEAADSQFVFSASQQFFFPGKRALKGEAATREAESLSASSKAVRLRTIATIKELYYDLFLAHQSMDLVREKGVLLRKIEDAALARYASGGGMQQDVLMAQTEKYMLLEREEMLKQRIKTLEAALNSIVGRDQAAPLDRPVAPVFAPYSKPLPDLIAAAYENSPEVKSRGKMVASLDAKVRVAEREYYPDITVTGNYGLKGTNYEDMWSLSTTVNIPLYYTTKQRPAVHEAEASLSGAKNELQTIRLQLSSAIQENYALLQTTERLMELYRQGLNKKIHQDFQAALVAYATGKTDALTMISRIKTITEIETSYWGQLVEREKALARLEALTGGDRFPHGGRATMNKMNSMILIVLFIAVVVFVGFVGKEGGIFRKKSQQAAMQPAAQRQEQAAPSGSPETGGETAPPGKQPFSGNGQPVAAPEEEAPTVEIPEAGQRFIGVKTTAVVEKKLNKTIRTVGRVEYDERKIATVNTKIEGWIENLRVDYTGKYVKKGETLAEIYSPELVAAQQEYLNILKWSHQGATSPGVEDSSGMNRMLAQDAEAMRQATRQRLRFFDITEAQIRKIEETGSPLRTLAVFSPVSGYVVQKSALQGMKVRPGEKLFDLVDTSTVWVVSDIYEYELASVRTGQKAEITVGSLPGRVFVSAIEYVAPILAGETRTDKVRFTLENKGGQLKPQMFANVEIKIPLGSRLVVPDAALINTGARQLVYVDKGDGYFEPREVTVGAKAEGMTEIIRGLQSGEKVASAATFLIDSEARLKGVVKQ